MGVRVAVISHAAVLPINAEPFAALAAAGAEVTLIAPSVLDTDLRGRLHLRKLPALAGSTVGVKVSLGGYRRWLGGQRGIHLIVYRRLADALDSARPEVLFVEEEPYSFAALQALQWSQSRKVPFVVHQNQNLPRNLPRPFERIRQRVVAHASGFTVRNPGAEALLREQGFQGPIETFPHAIEPSRYLARANDAALLPPVVGFVGRLVAEKGIIELIDALGELRANARDERPSGHASLLVVGDGPLRREAEARALTANLPSRFVGAIDHDEMPRWYPAMDVVAVPSRPTQTWAEQFGRVPVEANAAGVPVVVSDSGELPRTVEATEGGLVYALDDPGALGRALTRMLDDPVLRTHLSSAGREGVRRRFTHEAVARTLIALLERVKEGR